MDDDTAAPLDYKFAEYKEKLFKTYRFQLIFYAILVKDNFQTPVEKDFIDLYAVLKMKFSVAEVCELFKRRFKDTGINYYHVLKSLVFFEDAEQEPSPLIILSGEEWKWENVKSFFMDNIKLFEKELGLE